MTTTQGNTVLRDAALEYARQGWAVFPCTATKTPLTAHGFEDADVDESRISAWWKDTPDALIGLAVPEGFIVVDIDPRNGGDDTIKALMAEHGRGAFPVTRSARTGGGGIHRWYAVDPELRLRGKLGVGVDVKRAGKGYVIVPPSVSVAGPYSWRDEREPVTAPEWLLEALQAPVSLARAQDVQPGIFPFMDGTTYGERAMQLELEKLADAQPGERNDALNSAAFSLAQLVAGGELREDPVRERLEQSAEELGLEARETALTIDSGFAAGLADPRSAPPPDDRDRQPSTRNVLDLVQDDDEPEDAEAHFWLDWTGDAEEHDWILEPVIPRNAYILVYGATEAAKSMVFNALGAEASCYGYTVSVYSLENPPQVDRARLQRLSPCEDTFRLSNQLLNLADPAQVKAMAQREHGRDLVIIDTYSHAFAQRYDSGDGNAKAIEFARVIRWLMKKTGATFIVVDHTGFERQEEPRDASAKRQQVDIAIGMERTQNWERGKPAHARMTNHKSARFANPFKINVKIVGNGADPLVFEWTGDPMEWWEP